MASLFGSVLVVSLLALGLAALFLVAVHRRWFSRFTNGFAITLTLAVVGIAIFAVWITGAWAYREARGIILDQVRLDLQNIGDILEREIQDEIEETFTQLTHLAEQLSDDRLEPDSLQVIEHDLREIVRVNTDILQLEAADENGARVAAATLAPAAQPSGRVGMAYCLDGRRHASAPQQNPAFASNGHSGHLIELCVPILTGSKVVGALNAHFDIQRKLSSLLTSATFNATGKATLVGADGRVLADPAPARLNEDLSATEAVRAAFEGRSGVSHIEENGEVELAFYRPLKNPTTINPGPWALLTEINEAEAVAPLASLRNKILLGAIALTLVGTLVALAVAGSIGRPVRELVRFAQKVKEGDLTARANVTGRDAGGQLAAALNGMVQGLLERDRVKEVFGRYVATQVSEKLLRGEVNLGGERKRVTILFSDIRNFTTMSEMLPPEQVVEFLNDYFTEMVDAVFEQGGMLDKFIGDGLMAVFGSTDDSADHPRQAVSAALRMQALLGKINGERAMNGKPPIAIGIGIHTDDVIVGNIGSRKRLEYTVVGDGVNTSSRLQDLNKLFGTTILISEHTYRAVQDHFVCRVMQHAELKGKTKDLVVYEVVSLAEAPVV